MDLHPSAVRNSNPTEVRLVQIVCTEARNSIRSSAARGRVVLGESLLLRGLHGALAGRADAFEGRGSIHSGVDQATPGRGAGAAQTALAVEDHAPASSAPARHAFEQSAQLVLAGDTAVLDREPVQRDAMGGGAVRERFDVQARQLVILEQADQVVDAVDASQVPQVELEAARAARQVEVMLGAGGRAGPGGHGPARK